MTLKYDFTPDLSSNPLVNMFLMANNASHTLLAYALVLIFFGVAAWVFIRVSDDVSLSLLQATFVGFIFMILFFYMGVTAGVTVIHGVSVFAVSCVMALHVGFLYYDRTDRQ